MLEFSLASVDVNIVTGLRQINRFITKKLYLVLLLYSSKKSTQVMIAFTLMLTASDICVLTVIKLVILILNGHGG